MPEAYRRRLRKVSDDPVRVGKAILGEGAGSAGARLAMVDAWRVPQARLDGAWDARAADHLRALDAGMPGWREEGVVDVRSWRRTVVSQRPVDPSTLVTGDPVGVGLAILAVREGRRGDLLGDAVRSAWRDGPDGAKASTWRTRERRLLDALDAASPGWRDAGRPALPGKAVEARGGAAEVSPGPPAGVYRATADELADAGAASLDELVTEVVRLVMGSPRARPFQGDWPRTRKQFLRLAGRARDLRGRVKGGGEGRAARVRPGEEGRPP